MGGVHIISIQAVKVRAVQTHCFAPSWVLLCGFSPLSNTTSLDLIHHTPNTWERYITIALWWDRVPFTKVVYCDFLLFYTLLLTLQDYTLWLWCYDRTANYDGSSIKTHGCFYFQTLNQSNPIWTQGASCFLLKPCRGKIFGGKIAKLTDTLLLHWDSPLKALQNTFATL